MEVCREGFIEHRKPTNRVYLYHLYYTSFTIISWTESTSLALWAPDLFGRNNSKTDRHSLPTQIKISTRRKKTCPHFHRDLSIKSLFIIFRPKYGEQRNFKRGEEETSGTNRLQTSALENTPRHTYICTLHTRYHYRLAPSIPLFTARSIRYDWAFVSPCSAIIHLGVQVLAIPSLSTQLASCSSLV
jgi:hypothetical protein